MLHEEVLQLSRFLFSDAVVPLQSLRDAIIVTSCGAEALPFITAFGVLPASFLFFWYYDQLVSLCTSCRTVRRHSSYQICNHWGELWQLEVGYGLHMLTM